MKNYIPFRHPFQGYYYHVTECAVYSFKNHRPVKIAINKEGYYHFRNHEVSQSVTIKALDIGRCYDDVLNVIDLTKLKVISKVPVFYELKSPYTGYFYNRITQKIISKKNPNSPKVLEAVRGDSPDPYFRLYYTVEGVTKDREMPLSRIKSEYL